MNDIDIDVENMDSIRVMALDMALRLAGKYEPPLAIDIAEAAAVFEGFIRDGIVPERPSE